MIDMNSVVNVFFGAVLGVTLGLPRRTVYRGRAYHLHQDSQFWQVVVAICVVLVLFFVMWFGEIRLQWLVFLTALVVVSFCGFIASQRALEGRAFTRWAIALRSLYTDESYRYVDYSPRMGGAIADLFDPRATEFSLSNAVVCAHLSQTAYLAEDAVKEAARKWDCHADFIEVDNHAAIVAVFGGAVIVAFRGTDDFRDWLTNFAVWRKTPWGSEWGHVHGGFLSAVDAVWPKVQSAIQCQDVATRRLWFTGHSLGGAMAVLAAAKITAEMSGVEVSGVYTFGQPRVGDVRFCRALGTQLSGRLVRFETPRDEVPNQPRGSLHAGLLQYFDRFGRLHANPGFAKKLADQARRDSLGLVGEHRMRAYLRLVEGACIERMIEELEAAQRAATNKEPLSKSAEIHRNLAFAYGMLPTGERVHNLERAIRSWRAALRLYTDASFPSEWASAQSQLGSAYFELADADRQQSQQHLKSAIDAWESSLRVHTEADFPEDWARTQNDLGLAYAKLVDSDPLRRLRTSIQCLEASLRVYSETNRPTVWQSTRIALDFLYAQLEQNELKAGAQAHTRREPPHPELPARSHAPAPETDTGIGTTVELVGNGGRFELGIAAESRRQAALEALAARRTDLEEVFFSAALVPDRTNHHDANAIKVCTRGGEHVGYLSREDAARYRPLRDALVAQRAIGICRAKLVAAAAGQPSISVVLDVGDPATEVAAMTHDVQPL
jgi:tetratricopeptide (TPR) repeat protein